MSAGTSHFGRYRILERLGAGGMAEVFRAVVNEGTARPRSLVVKRILPELSRNPEFVRLLVDEARLSARLHHPGIVEVYELGEVDGEHYIAMEYVEGRNLALLLTHLVRRKRQMPPALACYLVREVAAALGYAHALIDDQGRSLEIIHRDVSPSNIQVSTTGAVKLLDFGIAKAASGIRNEETRTGVVKGKISYMSPEQADGRAIDRRSDIFALGIVFWECLTSNKLFRGSDDLHTLRLVREAEIEPPSRTVSGIDSDIEAVLLKMLARRREDRYATCQEIVAALTPIVRRSGANADAMRRFLADLPLDAAGDAPSPIALGEGVTLSIWAPTKPPATAALEKPKRRRALILAVAAVPVAALALGLTQAHRLRRGGAISPAPSVAPARPIVGAPPAPSASPPAPAPPEPPALPPGAIVPERHAGGDAHHRSPPHKRRSHSHEIHDPFAER
jgi:tRNA A-37 threonylcarbamoyl transferase component Bud32